MGNKLAKEKRQAIETQRQNLHAKGALSPTIDLVVSDVIDSPHYDIARDVPKYQAFFFPPSLSDTAASEYLSQICLGPFTLSDLNLASFPPQVGVHVFPLLPIIFLRCSQLTRINLTGCCNDAPRLALFLSTIPTSPSLACAILHRNSIGPQLVDLTFSILRAFPPRQVPLELEYIENPFWDPASEQWNISAEAAISELASKRYMIRFPSKPEKPFDVEGVPVLPSAVVDASPIAIGGRVFVSKALFDFAGVRDDEAKIKFLVDIVNKIIALRRRPDCHPALRYIPRIYHIQRESPTIVGIISESIAQNFNFGTLEDVLTPDVAALPNLLWRVDLMIQVSHVVHFFHSEAGAAIRNITPKDILVDIQNHQMRYTNVEALRSPQALSVVKKNDKVKYKFEDPKYAGLDRRVTMPRDLYPMAQLAFYLFCFNPNPDVFKKDFAFPFIDASDIEEPTRHYAAKLDASLGERLCDDEKQVIGKLIAESTQPTEECRPSVEAFLQVWQDMKRRLSKCMDD